MVVTLLRGFKVSISTLDAFLAANGVDETYGDPPIKFAEDYPTNDAISALLHTKLGLDPNAVDPDRMMARVVIPQRKFMGRATIAYVAYAWVMSFAHCEIHLDSDLPLTPSPTFETLRQEILGYSSDDEGEPGEAGKMGMFLVVTDEGKYIPEVMKQRNKVPQQCDQCDESFDSPQAWSKRQDHRRQVHGALEGDDPLPEA